MRGAVSPADGCVGGSGALSRVRVRLRSEAEKEGTAVGSSVVECGGRVGGVTWRWGLSSSVSGYVGGGGEALSRVRVSVFRVAAAASSGDTIGYRSLREAVKTPRRLAAWRCDEGAASAIDDQWARAKGVVLQALSIEKAEGRQPTVEGRG
jgi:hypothetical protein